LTNSEIQILRFIQKHKDTTPAAYLAGTGLGDENRVTIRKAMLRLEEQGFLSSINAGAQVRAYSLSKNVSKIDFSNLKPI